MTKIKSEAFFLVRKGAPSGAFERRELLLDPPAGSDIIVESEAFGLNYADVMARLGLYREAPPFPCVIGYETVGIVSHVGPESDASLLGKRVIAFCRFGGYARHVRTFDYAAVPVGDQPAEELMALCTQAVTAYYMSEYLSPVHPEDTVLVHAAAGGVGTMLIQLAVRKGATVIAKIGDEKKAGLVKNLGASHIVNYRAGDYETQIRDLLKGKKVDISFNPVAGSTFKKDMRLLGSGGRMVLFGGSELGRSRWGALSALNFVRKMGFVIPVGLMMQSKNILGVNMLRIADHKPEVLKNCLNAVVELYLAGELSPQVGGYYSADQLPEAHSALEGGKSTGKISVRWT